MRSFLGLLLVLSPVLFLGAEKKLNGTPKTKVEYYYTFPEELSGNDGWAYQTPECATVSAEVKAAVTDCEKFQGHKICYSKGTVGIDNVLTEQTAKARIRYHIFSSLDSCISDRAAALESGD